MRVEIDEEFGREHCERSSETKGTSRNYCNGYMKETAKMKLGEMNIQGCGLLLIHCFDSFCVIYFEQKLTGEIYKMGAIGRMIRHIKLENVATYTEPVDVNFKALNFIYGGNGTGKTTISKLISGEIQHPLIQEHHPAIVSKELFENANGKKT